MIEFACPSCQSPYRVPEEHQGRKTVCRQCRQPLEVPHQPEMLAIALPMEAAPEMPAVALPMEAAPEVPALALPAEMPPDTVPVAVPVREARRPWSSRALLAGGIAAALLLILGVWLVGRPGTPVAPTGGGEAYGTPPASPAVPVGMIVEAAAPAPGSLPRHWDAPVEGKPTLVLEAEGHTAAVRKALLRDGGRQAITVSLDKTVRVWDAETGDLLRTFWLPAGPGERGQLEAAALSPDESVLAVAGRGPDNGPAPIYLLALDTGQVVRSITGQEPAIRTLAFAPDGQWLAAGGDGKLVWLYHVPTGKAERSFPQSNPVVFSLAFSPDSKELLVGGHNEARIWPVRGGQRLAAWSPSLSRSNSPDSPQDVNELRDRWVLPEPITAVAWHPDGASVAVGTKDGVIRVHSARGAQRARYHLSQSPAKHTTQAVTGLHFMDGGKALFYTGCNVRGRAASGVLDAATGERLAEIQLEAAAQAGAISADGRRAVLAGVPANGAIVWHTADGAEVATLAGRAQPIPVKLAWSANKQTLAWRQSTGPTTDPYPLDRAFRLDEMQAGEAPTEETVPWAGRRFPQPDKFTIRAGGDKISRVPVGFNKPPDARTSCGRDDEQLGAVCYLANGRAAVAGRFGIYIVDIDKVEVVRTLTGHTAPVRSLTPTADGRLLASTSEDQSIAVWDPDRSEPLLSLYVTETDWVAWNPQGYYAASPGGERLMGWLIGGGPDSLAAYHPAAQFRKSLCRPDLLRQAVRTGNPIPAPAGGGALSAVQQARPPLVAITDPPGPAGHRVAGTKLTVRAAARSVGGHPVTALRLLVDGRPYDGTQGIRTLAKPQVGDVEVSWQVELAPGKHVLAVQADSTVSKGLSPVVELTNTAGTSTPPNLYVVAVGINAYPGALGLRYAAPDAEAISAVLSRQAKSKVFGAVESKLLRDRQAGRREIEQALTWLKAKMTPQDVGVFFFSGHGDRDDRGTFHLLPVDVNPRDIAGSCISGDYLKQILGDVPGRVVAVLDACHSGAAIDAGRRSPPADDLIRDLASDEYGIIVLSSSRGQEYSLEGGTVEHGFFTQALIEGLAGLADKNRNGVVDLNEIDRYTARRVTELSHDRQHPVMSRPASIRAFSLAISARMPERPAPPVVPEVTFSPIADKTELQGLWQVLEYQFDGEPRDTKDYFWAIHRDTIRHDSPNSGSSWHFKLNASTSPNQIDIPQRSPFPNRVYTMPGIYVLDGETLKVCFRVTEGERPTEFAAPRDSRRALLVMKRISPDPEAPKPTRPWQPPVGIVSAGMIQTQAHLVFVSHLGLSSDGKSLCIGGTQGIAEWDIKTLKFRRWAVKTDHANVMSTSADGKTAVFDTPLLTALVVDLATGKELAKFKAPQISAAALSPDGKQVVLCSNVARLIDVAGGREQELPKGEADRFAHAVAFAPDGKQFAVAYSRQLYLFDVVTGKEVRNWDHGLGNIRALRFAPDGKSLAGGSREKPTIKLWEVDTGREVRTISGHEEPISAVDFSPDGKWLASTATAQMGARSEIKVWEVSSGKEAAAYAVQDGGGRAVMFTPDGGRILAVASGRIDIWWFRPSLRPAP